MLTETAETADGGTGGANCPTTWSVSGSTATAVSGQTCSRGGRTLTVTSGTFEVSESNAAQSGTLAISGTTTDTDGGTATLVGAASYTGTCKKN
jgi:hypothetical protein